MLLYASVVNSKSRDTMQVQKKAKADIKDSGKHYWFHRVSLSLVTLFKSTNLSWCQLLFFTIFILLIIILKVTVIIL